MTVKNSPSTVSSWGSTDWQAEETLLTMARRRQWGCCGHSRHRRCRSMLGVFLLLRRCVQDHTNRECSKSVLFVARGVPAGFSFTGEVSPKRVFFKKFKQWFGRFLFARSEGNIIIIIISPSSSSIRYRHHIYIFDFHCIAKHIEGWF